MDKWRVTGVFKTECGGHGIYYEPKHSSDFNTHEQALGAYGFLLALKKQGFIVDCKIEVIKPT